jgi:hypothetical protein
MILSAVDNVFPQSQITAADRVEAAENRGRAHPWTIVESNAARSARHTFESPRASATDRPPRGARRYEVGLDCAAVDQTVLPVETCHFEAFEQARLTGVHRPQLGQPLPERCGVAVAFAEVAQVDEELDGGVVLAWFLRGDEFVDPLPCGGLVDREGVEVPLPGGCR